MAQSKFCQLSSYLFWMSAALLQNNGAGLMDGHQGTAAFPASALLLPRRRKFTQEFPMLVNSSSRTGAWGCACTPHAEQRLQSRGSLHTGAGEPLRLDRLRGN